MYSSSFTMILCFVKDRVTINILLWENLHKGLYQFNLTKQQTSNAFDHSSNIFVIEAAKIGILSPSFLYSVSNESLESFNESFDVWHQRLGHPSLKIVTQILNQYNVPYSSNKTSFFCIAYLLGKKKNHNLSFLNSNTTYREQIQLVKSDLWGPSPIFSYYGYKYYVNFVDVYSRFTWIYFLKNKSQAHESFVYFKTQVENQLNSKLKIFQSDWDGEFRTLTLFLDYYGIIHRVSCPHTLKQNGIVKSKHKHIVELGLTLLAQASLPLKFWPNSFSTVVFLINKLPILVLMLKSPIEVLYKVKLDFSTLKVFGCLCFLYL